MVGGAALYRRLALPPGSLSYVEYAVQTKPNWVKYVGYVVPNIRKKKSTDLYITTRPKKEKEISI